MLGAHVLRVEGKKGRREEGKRKVNGDKGDWIEGSR